MERFGWVWQARFAAPVVPGQTLRTDMWRQGNRIHVTTTVLETGKTVLAGAYVDLKAVTSSTSATPAAAAASVSTGLQSEAVFAEMARRLEAQPALASKIGAVFQWNITSNGQPAASWSTRSLLSFPKKRKSAQVLLYFYQQLPT